MEDTNFNEYAINGAGNFETLRDYQFVNKDVFRWRFYANGRWQIKKFMSFLNSVEDEKRMKFIQESLSLLQFYYPRSNEAHRLIEAIKKMLYKEEHKIAINSDIYDFIDDIMKLNNKHMNLSDSKLAEFVSANYITGKSLSTIRRMISEAK